MSGDTITPVKVGQRILVINPAKFQRTTPEGKLKFSTLLGVQGTVTKPEGSHTIVRKTLFGLAYAIVRGYGINLQNGEDAILERHEFIPIDDPPKQQEQEKEECLDVPALSV